MSRQAPSEMRGRVRRALKDVSAALMRRAWSLLALHVRNNEEASSGGLVPRRARLLPGRRADKEPRAAAINTFNDTEIGDAEAPPGITGWGGACLRAGSRDDGRLRGEARARLRDDGAFAVYGRFGAGW